MQERYITTVRSREDAHKLGFLANEYPDKGITELAEMFQMAALDYNVAVWRAIEMGFFTLDDKGNTTVHDIPGKWVFGTDVDDLIQAIPYALYKLAEKEGDMEENYMANWVGGGYKPQDMFCALKWLLNEKVIATYDIENTTVEKASKKGKKKGKKDKVIKDVYTFYTLPENEKHHWGLKQFKDQKRVKVVEK